MLELRGLYGGYGGTPVLRGVDLTIGSTEIVALLGRNGVGKTTLLRAVMGIIRLQAGTIRLAGAGDLTALPPHRRARMGLGYVPQGRQIFPRLTVLDNLRAAAMASGQDPKSRIPEVLAEFPVLEEKLRALGGSLSGGQQQILALARALVTRPRVLLLDEPTEGIQPSIVDLILEKIREVQRKHGIAVLLVEQNLDFAAELASRVYLMNKGSIVKELEPKELLADPELQHEYLVLLR